MITGDSPFLRNSSYFQIDIYIIQSLIILFNRKEKMDNIPALCPPNITIHNIWINHGVSQCFLETLSSAIMAGFILFFGTIQLIIYKRHATRVESSRLRSSMLYKIQHLLLLTLAIATIARLYVEFKYFGGIQIYGYMVS